MDNGLIFAAILFGAAVTAGLIRFGIRSYFREKANHLMRLLGTQNETQNDNEKEK